MWRIGNWGRRVGARPSDFPPAYDWAVLAVVVAYNPLANEVVPESLYVPVTLLVAALLVWLARRSGTSFDLLGMRRDRLLQGLVVGAAAALLAVLVVGVLALIPGSRSFLADDRFIGVSGAEAMYEALVRIPLGTALGEEIIFRGVLLGLFLRRFTVGRAVLAATALFGLWHILPTLDSLQTSRAGDLLDTPAEVGAAVAGTVFTTAIAGVVFAWLRFRAASIAAPVVLHLAINGSAYMAGWLLVSGGWA